MGGLPAGVQQGSAVALCAQQTLSGHPTSWETHLQPLPLPGCVANRALDTGTGLRPGVEHNHKLTTSALPVANLTFLLWNDFPFPSRPLLSGELLSPLSQKTFVFYVGLLSP